MTIHTVLLRRWLLRILVILVTVWIVVKLIDVISFHLPVIFYNGHFLRFYWRMGRCSFRKTPLVQIVDDRTVAVTWETNCRMPSSQFRWKIRNFPNQAIGRGRPFGRYCVGREEDSIAEHSLAFEAFEEHEVQDRHHLYRVIVKDLPAGKWCEYQVQLDRGRLPYIGIFPVPPFQDENQRISVALLGDSQMGMRTFNRLLAMAAQRPVDLLVHLGDLVQRPYSMKDWETCFWLPMAQHFSQKPLVLIPGNHDAILGERMDYFAPVGSNVTQMLADGWDRSFVRKHAYHAFTVGPVRWISLDTNEESDDQVHWLEQELSLTQKSPFRIVLLHIPPFIDYWDPLVWPQEKTWPVYARTRLVPLFEKYRVDLVISGHQHNYQRGYHNGIHYVISGGAGGELDTQQVENTGVYRHTFIEHHYLHLQATKEAIHLSCYNLYDRLLDSVEIPRSTIRKIKAAE